MHNLQVKEPKYSGTSATQLPELLDQSIACLEELGADYASAVEELELIQQRLAEGRFHLAVLGQFKRGKSTLLNALLGEDLLPTDILPVTAIPTFIKAGDLVTAQVYFTGEKEPISFSSDSEQPLAGFLADYVTESGNPLNQRQVERVEIAHPAALLKQGVVLIDTPGIGSTLKHNTAVAHRILPQCDAALFLVSPDPPITEVELDYLQQISRKLPRTFFLLNKVDFLDSGEQLASLRFLSEQLKPLCGDQLPHVIPISARQGLRARLEGKADGWKNSGMQQVEQNLIDFFAREKQQTLHLALTRRSGDLLGEAIMQLRLSLSALKLPVDILQGRIDQFRQSLPAIEREQQAAADVLEGDLRRAIGFLGEEIEKTRMLVKERVGSRVNRYLETIEDPEEMERLVRTLVIEEIQPFFAPAMQEVGEAVRREATKLLALNQQRSNRLIEQVRQTAAELFSIPYNAPAARTAYLTFDPPAWSNDLFISDMDPLGQRLSRRFLTKKYRRKRTVERLREETRKLLNQNVEQISWALRRSLDESFRHFGVALREQLEKTIAATRKAMDVALERSASHSHATAAGELLFTRALSRLEALRQELI
jgi:GTP-binding protein EngB required for normal cell division